MDLDDMDLGDMDLDDMDLDDTHLVRSISSPASPEHCVLARLLERLHHHTSHLFYEKCAISILLDDGDVLFSESNTELDSCRIYVIEGEISEKNLKITVENCEKLATVVEAELLEQ